MKQNRILLVAAIAAAMLASCTPETSDPQAQAESRQSRMSTEYTKPQALAGTQWLDHEDYWEHNLPYIGDMHVLVDYRWTFLSDSIVILTSSGPGAENFPAYSTEAEVDYTYNPETGILVLGEDAAFQTATYNQDINAFVLENGIAFYREY